MIPSKITFTNNNEKGDAMDGFSQASRNTKALKRRTQIVKFVAAKGNLGLQTSTPLITQKLKTFSREYANQKDFNTQQDIMWLVKKGWLQRPPFKAKYKTLRVNWSEDSLPRSIVAMMPCNSKMVEQEVPKVSPAASGLKVTEELAEALAKEAPQPTQARAETTLEHVETKKMGTTPSLDTKRKIGVYSVGDIIFTKAWSDANAKWLHTAWKLERQGMQPSWKVLGYGDEEWYKNMKEHYELCK